MNLGRRRRRACVEVLNIGDIGPTHVGLGISIPLAFARRFQEAPDTRYRCGAEPSIRHASVT